MLDDSTQTARDGGLYDGFAADVWSLGITICEVGAHVVTVQRGANIVRERGAACVSFGNAAKRGAAQAVLTFDLRGLSLCDSESRPLARPASLPLARALSRCNFVSSGLVLSPLVLSRLVSSRLSLVSLAAHRRTPCRASVICSTATPRGGTAPVRSAR